MNGGGGGFTFSVLYEISHFLHGRNIPLAICSKTIEKITVRLKSPTVIGVNSKRAGARLGKCGRRGGALYPLQRHLLCGCLQKATGNTCF